MLYVGIQTDVAEPSLRSEQALGWFLPPLETARCDATPRKQLKELKKYKNKMKLLGIII